MSSIPRAWPQALVVALAFSGLLAPSLLTAGDPHESSPEREARRQEVHPGFAVLIHKQLSSRALTVDELDALWTVWEAPRQAQARAASPAERRRMTFERYGLIHREFDDSGLPMGYTGDGQGNLAPNCLSCHGGKVGGRSFPGLANTHQDLMTLVEDLAALRSSRRGGDLDLARRGATFGFPLSFARGVTNSTQFSIVLGSLRDKDLNLAPPSPTGPLVHNDVDAPPWWNVKKKDKLYCDAMAPKTPRTIMQFAMAPGVSGEAIRSWEGDFEHILAYIEQLPPPPYPFAVDGDLAARGKVAFERVCARCHGTYGDDGKYPNRVEALEKVGTDPVRLGAVSREAKERYNQMWFSNYGEHPVDLEVKGYIAPPLDGIWASAPYLHNGSVPTLYHLFNPETRPRVWKRDENGFDRERVGLVVEELERMPPDLSPRQARQYYDTALPSHSATGHLFPDQELSDEEKSWVLEYLKTL